MRSIYFICDEKSEAFKVGISKNVKARLRGIQSSNPNELKLLGTIEGNEEREEQIHFKLWEYHIRGEWFRWCPETAYYLQGLGLDVKIPRIEDVAAFLEELRND